MIDSQRIRVLVAPLAAVLVAVACAGGEGGGATSDAGATDRGGAETSAPASEGTPAAGESAAESAITESPSPDDSGAGGATAVATAPTGQSGDIFISGSSTVQPISSAVAERFNQASPEVAITVDGPGTGDGFQLFCNGETDISNASRAIEEEEAQQCAENGIEYVELKIAIDGLSVITSAGNDQVECLTFADLYALLGPESTGISNWNDAEALAQELGSTTDLPDAELQITAPGEESGTYDSFVEIVIEQFNEDRGQEAQTRPDYTTSANDNAIIEGIAGSPTSLGWVGFAFAQENAGVVKALQVDSGESGCVEPTPETIANGEYPIARDLFIYVNMARAAESEALVSYVDYYLGEGVIDEVLTEVPYVALEASALEETRQAWEAARGQLGG